MKNKSFNLKVLALGFYSYDGEWLLDIITIESGKEKGVMDQKKL